MARWRDYHLSRLETIMAIILLLVILSALLNRVISFMAVAEKALVANVQTNISTALRLEEASYIARGRMRQLQELDGMNPASLLMPKTEDYLDNISRRSDHQALLAGKQSGAMPGYLGEFDDPQPREYPRGSWYFDKSQGLLVYKVRNAEVFRSSLGAPARIRFRVNYEYRDRNGNGRYDPDVDVYDGVKLVAVDDYEWLI